MQQLEPPVNPRSRVFWRRRSNSLSGRQLFERNRNLEHDDDSLMEEGTISVDISQYDRSQMHAHEDDNDDRVHFSDSD